MLPNRCMYGPSSGCGMDGSRQGRWTCERYAASSILRQRKSDRLKWQYGQAGRRRCVLDDGLLSEKCSGGWIKAGGLCGSLLEGSLAIYRAQPWVEEFSRGGRGGSDGQQGQTHISHPAQHQTLRRRQGRDPGHLKGFHAANRSVTQ